MPRAINPALPCASVTPRPVLRYYHISIPTYDSKPTQLTNYGEDFRGTRGLRPLGPLVHRRLQFLVARIFRPLISLDGDEVEHPPSHGTVAQPPIQGRTRTTGQKAQGMSMGGWTVVVREKCPRCRAGPARRFERSENYVRWRPIGRGTKNTTLTVDANEIGRMPAMPPSSQMS
jgi:hypothetical protein